MEKSISLKALGKALGLFQVKVGKIGKDATNPFFKSKYAPLPAILDAILLPLEECGLTISQLPDGEHGLTTILIHAESGEFLQSTCFMKPTKEDPQGIGSCITYQRRYALGAILCLNIDEDDDGNKASEPVKAGVSNDDARPWLTEKALNQAIERIKGGEKELWQKTIVAFKMKKQYRADLDNAYQTAKGE